MDNKIKIIASFIMGLLCFVSCAFDGDISLYDVKINNWSSLTYFVDRNNSSTSIGIIELYDRPSKRSRIGKREEVYSSDFNQRDGILQNPIELVYNNDYILASLNRMGDTVYYKITPKYGEDNITPLGYDMDTISQLSFKSLVNSCIDCEVLNRDKLAELDEEWQEEEKNNFPIKTILFFIFVFLILYLRFGRKKAK